MLVTRVDRTDVERVGKVCDMRLADKPLEGVGSALVRTLGIPLLLEGPPRGTKALLVDVFTRRESSLACSELAPSLSSASRSFFHLEQ